jgi:hypothetical protein
MHPLNKIYRHLAIPLIISYLIMLAGFGVFLAQMLTVGFSPTGIITFVVGAITGYLSRLGMYIVDAIHYYKG